MSNSKQAHAPINCAGSIDRAWSAPRLKRIGTIADVAGSQGTGPQGGGAKT